MNILSCIIIGAMALFALCGLLGGLSESDNTQEGGPYP